MEQYYSIMEVSKMMHLHYYTILDWCKTGKIPAICVNKTWRIPKKELEEFLEQGRVKKAVVVK